MLPCTIMHVDGKGKAIKQKSYAAQQPVMVSER